MSEDNATETTTDTEPDEPTTDASSETPTSDAATVETSVPDTSTPAVGEVAEAGRSHRKVREGNVISDKMAKTVVVAVIERIRHPKYGKFMMRTKKLYAHDEENDAHVGDKVRVMETRPMSKSKRWRVVEVLERAK